MKNLRKLSQNRDGIIAGAYTAGSTVVVGGIALACDAPVSVVVFMALATAFAGSVVIYTKSIDKKKDTE